MLKKLDDNYCYCLEGTDEKGNRIAITRDQLKDVKNFRFYSKLGYFIEFENLTAFENYMMEEE